MIFIDTSFLLENKTGVGFYTETLINILKIKKTEYKCINLNLPQNTKYKTIKQIIWQNSVLYIKTLIQKPDICIFPAFIMPYLKRRSTKYITVIHDLCSFRTKEMPGLFAKINRFCIKLAIKQADTIVTVSETVKQELINKFKVNPENIKVIYNSVSEEFINFKDNPEIFEKYNIQKQKYILSVATLNKRKNIPELIKAFETISDKYPNIKLVLVGGMGNEAKDKLKNKKNIIFTGYVSDEEIPVLYKHALIYIFPSLYEGFGIPLIEAQYSHIPVLCSDIPVFREITGNIAEYCEPNADSIALKTEYLINNPKQRENLIIKGTENVKRFCIENISKQLINAIEN